MITALAPRRSVVRPLMVPLTGGRPCSILCPWWLQFSAVSRFLSLVFYCICSSFLALPRLVSWWSWHDTNIWPVPTCGQPPVLPVCRVRLGEEETECWLLSVWLLHVNVGNLNWILPNIFSQHSANLGSWRTRSFSWLLLLLWLESPLELRLRLSSREYHFRNVHGCNVVTNSRELIRILCI